MNAKRSDLVTAVVCIVVFVGVNLLLFGLERFPVREAGLPDWTATFGMMAAAAMTFAIYSFLYKDNPFFRAAENLFVGLGLGVTFYVSWYQFFKPDIYDRLVRPALDPSVSIPGSDLWLIIPILLGVVLLTRISPTYGWLSRYPIAFMIGYGAGFSIQPTFHSLILKQVEKTIVPIEIPGVAWLVCALVAAAMTTGMWYASKGGRLGTGIKIACGGVVLLYVILRNTPAMSAGGAVQQVFLGVDSLLIILGVLGVLCYFFFSAEHRGLLGGASQVGIIFLMVSFGASFGYTVMARESLVIGRFQFLLGDWLGVL